MPNKPPSPCAHPGCSALALDTGNRCAAHRRVTYAQDRQVRGSSHERGYDARHRKWRLAVLARDPVCVMCNAELSTDADHIVALSKGGTWALTNGAGLCHGCHSRKTAREDGSFGREKTAPHCEAMHAQAHDEAGDRTPGGGVKSLASTPQRPTGWPFSRVHN